MDLLIDHILVFFLLMTRLSRSRCGQLIHLRRLCRLQRISWIRSHWGSWLDWLIWLSRLNRLIRFSRFLWLDRLIWSFRFCWLIDNRIVSKVRSCKDDHISDSLKGQRLRSLTFWEEENLLHFFILIHRDFHKGWMVGIDFLTAGIHTFNIKDDSFSSLQLFFFCLIGFNFRDF